MKKTFLYTFLLCMLGLTAMAQSPEAINYQGVARDASGTPIPNQAIGLQISIRGGSPSGTIQYQETHSITTNDLGLFTLQIGQGSVVSGTFATIAWSSNSHYVEVEMDPTGGTAYTSVGVSQLVSVPYALHATTVEIDQVDDADNDPANEVNTAIGLTGTNLSITDGGGTLTQDLSSLVDDADADPANELNTAFALTGTNLTLTDAGGTLTVDLSSLGGGGGGQWTASGTNIYNNNPTGNVGIGTTAPLKQLTVQNSSGASIGLGSSAFNAVESGRLTFSEDLTNAGGDCGFQFHHDGSANSLSLVTGCFIPSAGDTAFIVTRSSGYTNFKNRIKVGDVANPSANVHIKQAGTGTSPGASGLRLENSTTTAYNQLWTDGTNLNISLGASRIAFINNVGAYNQVSDRRMKANITSLTPVLAGVMSLNPVRYNYTYEGAEDKEVIGFVAQEVEQVFPELVNTTPGSDLRALSYGEFGVISIKAIQEQQVIIESQQQEIDALKAQVQELMELKKLVEEMNK